MLKQDEQHFADLHHRDASASTDDPAGGIPVPGGAIREIDEFTGLASGSA